MKTDISKWVNLKYCPLNSIDFADKCRQKLSDTGVLLLPQFLLPEAFNQTIKEAKARAHLAYFTKKTHNVLLWPMTLMMLFVWIMVTESEYTLLTRIFYFILGS